VDDESNTVSRVELDNYLCSGVLSRSISIAQSDRETAWIECSAQCINDCVQIAMNKTNATHYNCDIFSESMQSSNTLPTYTSDARCAYDAPVVIGIVKYSSLTTLGLQFSSLGPINARLAQKLRARPSVFQGEYVGTMKDVRNLDVGQINIDANQENEIVSNHQRYVTIRGTGFDDTFPAYNLVTMFNRNESVNVDVLGDVVNSSRTHLVLDVYQLSSMNEGELLCNITHFLSSVFTRLDDVAIFNATCFDVNVTAPTVETSESVLMSSATQMVIRGTGFIANDLLGNTVTMLTNNGEVFNASVLSSTRTSLTVRFILLGRLCSNTSPSILKLSLSFSLSHSSSLYYMSLQSH
jgi:hypothetical protein